MFSFPPQDPNQQPAPPPLDPMLQGFNPDEAMMEPVDPAAMPLEGEVMDAEEDVSEPAPRPIDWRVRKYWDDTEERHNLGRYLREEIDRSREAFSYRLSNIPIWRDDFSMMPAAADTPYPGAARCRAPFTRYACAAHTRQLNAQIVSPEPVVTVEPLDVATVQDAPDIEEAFNGRIEDSEWAREARALHADLPIAGNGFLRVEYERRTKRAPRLQVEFDERDYFALINAGADTLAAQVWALKRNKKGAIKYQLAWEEIVDYEGPGYKFIPFEDGVICPATCRDATKARAIGERFVISGLDLALGAKEGRFIQSEVDDLLKQHGDDPTRMGTDDSDRQDTLDRAGIEVSGDQGPLADHDAKYRDYLCYRLSLRLDGDDDGREEILLVTLHYDTERILDIRYSQYEHGEHIYHLAPFEAQPGELLGYGIAETVAVLQDAATAWFNQIINHGDLTINSSAMLIVDQNAMLDPEVQTLTMGTFFRVRDSQGIREFPVAQLRPEHYTLWQSFKDQVDLIAGVSNPSLGKGTDVGRTAREVMVVESHASANFEGVAEGLSLFWSRVWDQSRSIEAQFARDGQIQYRKSRLARAMAQGPEEAFGSIDAMKLLGKVRILPAGVRQLSDMQARMSQAMAMNQVFMENPLTQANPEVWRIAVEATMEAAKYGPKEKILMALDRAQAAAEQAAREQQMAAEEQAMAQTAMGLPPELAQALQQLPPEVLKGLMSQMQEQQAALPPSVDQMNVGVQVPALPGAAGPEQGGPMVQPGMM
jgi:hypothetical protein